jgi:hypothetical protein
MEAIMKYKMAIWILFVCLSSSFAFAQVNINQPFPFLDLIFPEVVAGGGIETLVTLSNRGTATYTGYAYLRTGAQFEWNPLVNGLSITGGEFPVSISPGRTVTYLITGSGSIPEVGGMIIVNAEDPGLTKYIEGNMTYFLTSGGISFDSIGVLPATPFVAASLPFEDFRSITLAFLNTDFEERTANVTFKLYDDSNVLRGTSTPDPLLPAEQRASYLYQLFPSVSSLASGRVEIQSDIPISGIAMMQEAVSGQFSSLPLGSTIRTYSVHTSDPNVGLTRMALWTNGPFVNGYMIMQYQSQPEFVLAFGQICRVFNNQRLRLHWDNENELTEHLLMGVMETEDGFTWEQTTINGAYWAMIPANDYLTFGTFTATLVIP